MTRRHLCYRTIPPKHFTRKPHRQIRKAVRGQRLPIKQRTSNSSTRYQRGRIIYFLAIIIPILLALSVGSFQITYQSHATYFTRLQEIIGIGKYFWLTGSLFVGTNLLGFFLYGYPKDPIVPYDRDWRGNVLFIAYVSRGDNHLALARSVAQTRMWLISLGVPHIIEVVTDRKLPFIIPGIRSYVVPEQYQTPRHSKYKARALQYLKEHRQAKVKTVDKRWVLHLDEESVVTPSAIAGIWRFVTSPSNHQSIGQGEILYNAHRFGYNLLVSAMDAVRTGDDLGRFRLQFRTFRTPVFGMHGSFILVPLAIENAIGFDLSQRGSITEDAYFAFKAAERGITFGWVDGYIREQSPYDLVSLIRQRRRWFCGLILLASDSEIPVRQRFWLAINMMLWGTSWIGPLVAVGNLVAYQARVPIWLTLLSSLILGGLASVYLVGALRNIWTTKWKMPRKALYICLAVLTLPFSSAIEGLAIIYALVSPVRTFEVVRKN